MEQRKRRKAPAPSSHFFFTAEAMNIALEGVKHFEQFLARTECQGEKVLFAKACAKCVTRKLEALSAKAGDTTFDYNERILLVSAIQMYRLDLNFRPTGPRYAQELKDCQRIIAFFAPKPHEKAHGTELNK